MIVGLLFFFKFWHLVGEYTKHALNYKNETHSIDFQVKDQIVYITIKEYSEIKKHALLASINLFLFFMIRVAMAIVSYYIPEYFDNLWLDPKIKK